MLNPADVTLNLDEIAKLIGELCCLHCQKKLYLALEKVLVKARLDLGQRHCDPGKIARLENTLMNICNREGILPKEVLSKMQSRNLVHVRRLFSLAARNDGFSFPEIGRFLGRHHSSIIHLVKQLPLDTTRVVPTDETVKVKIIKED